MTEKRNPKTDPATAGIKVIATRSAKTLSGTGTLTYKLGVDDEKRLYLRIHENSGGGFIPGDWYPAQAIADAVRACEGSESFTSTVLAPLFVHRSANLPSFFMAILRNEKAVLPYRRTARRHVLGDLEAFLKQGGSTQASSKPRPTRRATTKAKATTRRKPKTPST